MRHVLGLLFGIVLAPVTWFLAALGHFRFLDALQRFGDNPDKLPTELAFGAVLIVAAGAWLGVLLSSRLSPLAPAVTGLTWLAMGSVFVFEVERVTNLLPNGPSGQEGLFALPLEHGYAFLVGTALMSPVFSPARWRGSPRAIEASGMDTAEPTTQDSYRTGSHQTVDGNEAARHTGSYPVITSAGEPPADKRGRYARPARDSGPADVSAVEARSGRTGSYRTSDYREQSPGRGAAADQHPRLAGWNEDGANETSTQYRSRER